MNLLQIALYEIAFYSGWWFMFVPVAYFSTRYFGWTGIFIGAAVLSILITYIDVHWIFDDMRNHPENERDADVVFWFGVLCRIALFNTVLLPASVTGLTLRSRSRNAKQIAG